MATIDVKSDDFERTVAQDGIVLVDFWAESCGPCQTFSPVFAAAAEQNIDLTFAKIDTHAEREIVDSLEITTVPTLMVFRDGIQLFTQPGAIPAHALDDVIDQARALDMDEVRADVAAQQTPPPR